MTKAKTKPINIVDQMLPLIAETVQEWKNEHTGQRLKDRVKRLLNEHSEEVTMKLLGFNASWNKWEIDHCNGRSGESAAGDFIRKHQSEAIHEWLTTVCLPVLDEKTKAQFQKQANQLYKETILYGLRKTVEQKAQKDLDALLKVVTTSDQVDNYIKTMQLLTSQEISHASEN